MSIYAQGVPHIDDMPNLCASLGAAKVDRIRDYLTDKNAVGTGRTRWIQNPHQYFLSSLKSLYENQAVDDIITGIAALDQGSDKTLAPLRLFNLLACNKRLSTELVIVVMNLSDRQARKYMAAARLCIFHLTRAGVEDTWEIIDELDNPWLELRA